MTTFQKAKARIKEHHAALSQATADTIETALGKHLSADALWRGMHPFHEQSGPQAIAQSFWIPLLNSFQHIQRREDVFFAGENSQKAGGTWVASMGHLMGLFDATFLGIPATGKIAMLRYAEFSRVEGDQIIEQAFFVDLLHLMHQAGFYPLPNMTAAQLVQPGPMTHDGLLTDPQPEVEGEKTLALISRMLNEIDFANSGNTKLSPKEELQLNWHDNMVWWGPTGIGATYTIDRYAAQHQQVFRKQLSNRVFNGHICRIAEGTYGGFFGWPNITIECSGPFLGLPPSGKKADLRVVDIYRRDGDKLAENWIFIDMLHFLNMQGLDVLAQLHLRGR